MSTEKDLLDASAECAISFGGDGPLSLEDLALCFQKGAAWAMNNHLNYMDFNRQDHHFHMLDYLRRKIKFLESKLSLKEMRNP